MGHRETARQIEAFEVWYQQHRSYTRTLQHVAVSQRALFLWTDWFHWHARADARDREAARIADADAVKRRAEMLRRHRQAGELLTRRGMEHHAQRPIEKASDATAAIKAGIEIERTAEGYPTVVAAILGAESEDELAKIRRQLLAPGAGEAADAAGLEGEPAPEEQPAAG